MDSEHLHWRYATKQFDSKQVIPQPVLESLLESLRLAPSSFGLQPWKFLVIRDLELRKKIQSVAWNQTQVTECSHLIVLCTLKDMDETYVKNFIKQTAQTRAVSAESLAGYEQMMLGFLKNLSPGAKTDWMGRQIYLALGMLLAECAFRRIDACPMEGFDPNKFDGVMGLEKLGLKSVVLCPVGYRAGSDKHAGLKKIRFPSHEVFVHL